MWPMNDQTMKDDEPGRAHDPGEGPEEPPADAPDDTEEGVPEEPGYGYGV